MHKTRDFRNWVKSQASRQGQLPEHSRQKFWKIYLSVFRNWSSTRERVARWAAKISESFHNWTFHLRTSRQTESRETLKTQILKNIQIIFRN